jgi:nicotinamide-nucleotide adenylyltransferase
MLSNPVKALGRLQRGISTVELVHTPHERWPYTHPPQRLPCTCSRKQNVLRIAVLDSSFNPPTLAHLALANSVLPHHSGAFGSSSDVSEPSTSNDAHQCNYDARMLLLSVRNADKSLGETDATYVQRLEMMTLLSKDVVIHGDNGTLNHEANVAVAIIDEPTFVGKSAKLLTFLRGRLADLSMPESTTSQLASDEVMIPKPQLIFLQGLDTLERLFSPRYYPSGEDAMLSSLLRFFSPNGDDCRVVCARRPLSSPRAPDSPRLECLLHQESERENRIIALGKTFFESGRIVIIDIGAKEQTLSSSELRQKILSGNEDWRSDTTKTLAKYIAEQRLYHK